MVRLRFILLCSKQWRNIYIPASNTGQSPEVP